MPSEEDIQYVRIPVREWRRLLRFLNWVEPLIKESQVDKWIDKDEAMKLLKCSRATLNNLMNKGAINYTTGGGRTRLYSRDSIMAFLEKNSTR